jgi:hypothetical protein
VTANVRGGDTKIKNCVSTAAFQALSSNAEALFEFLWSKITSDKLFAFFAIEKIFA